MPNPDPDLLSRGGVRLDVDGAVATVTLDRPEVRNAQTRATWDALAAIGAGLADEVRVVVLRGDGPSFSAGLDLRLVDGRGVEGEDDVPTLMTRSDAEIEEWIAGCQAGFTWLRDPRFVEHRGPAGPRVRRRLPAGSGLRPPDRHARRTPVHEGGRARARPGPHGNKAAGRAGWVLTSTGHRGDGPGRGGRGGRSRPGSSTGSPTLPTSTPCSPRWWPRSRRPRRGGARLQAADADRGGQRPRRPALGRAAGAGHAVPRPGLAARLTDRGGLAGKAAHDVDGLGDGAGVAAHAHRPQRDVGARQPRHGPPRARLREAAPPADRRCSSRSPSSTPASSWSRPC